METTERTLDSHTDQGAAPPDPPTPALVVVWWRSCPERVGEVLLPPERGVGVFGREAAPDPEGRTLHPVRQVPGDNLPTAPVQSPRLSRKQLALTRVGEDLGIRNLGRRALLVGEESVAAATVRPGDLVEIERELLLLCVRRPRVLPGSLSGPVHRLGAPDRDGIVGESPAAWALRAQLAFVARRQDHVLVLGPSGAGKELVARAVHRGSPRSAGPWISRNASTLPESLVDAELFGNRKDYPNPGMPERPGLVGAAHGGTLMLDELGELPHSVQAHLLRLLDTGEYQRLGEATLRCTDLRLVGATNRAVEALKHDLAARLPLRIEATGLDARREDLPLLAAHLLRGIALQDAEIALRFFPDGDPQTAPRLAPALVRQLLLHSYATHIRELRALLWTAMAASPGDQLEPIAKGSSATAPQPPNLDRLEEWRGKPPGTLPPTLVQAVLDECNGVQELAWVRLGLESRYQLRRLIRRHGLVLRRQG